jgi:hypothetical protein
MGPDILIGDEKAMFLAYLHVNNTKLYYLSMKNVVKSMGRNSQPVIISNTNGNSHCNM